MIRSSSMEQAVSILEEAGSGISIYHTPSGDDEPPLPKTPEPPRSASTVSNSSHFYLSPSFEINRSFRFLDDSDSLSPGISLVSSSSDIGSYLTPDGGWSSSPMATVDVRSSHGPGRFYTHHSSSLDSLDGLASSSNYDETGGSSNGIPLSRTSQPSLHFHFDDEESHLNESHRSRSLDDLSKGGRTDADSSYHSLGRVRRDSPASNNNNNIDKLTDFPALEAVSYAEELDNQNDAVFDTPEPVDSFPGSPRDDFGEKSRLLELPSISEETEETTRSRHSSASMHGSERHHLDYDGVPEPDHIAPGSYSHQLPKDFQELPSEAPIYHRRVVSDNHVNYSKPDEAFLPDPPPYPVLIRDAPARGSQNGRCMSQHILTTSQDSSPVSVVSDRSLSKSDPHLEEKIEQKLLLPVEDDDVHQTKTPVPPPVILTRKNSVVKGSWQNYFHSSAATPHTVITPATAGLTSRPKLPSNGSTETVKGSGVAKHKKSGSETFSIGSLFGGKKKPRSKLTNLINNASEPAPSSSTSSTLSTSSGSRQRGAIPSFHDVRPEFPDGLSNIFSGSSGSSPEDEDQHSEVDIFTTILENPRYARLGLFEEEIIAWHDKFNPNGLPRKAVKKQDAIYELIQLEKQHCANLAFLQEGYRRRLLDENILTREEVNNLIPDVIEALLLFHCNLLEHLQARQNESNEVETISDILIQEMGEDGLHTMKCIDAYTTFGSQKDRSEKLFVSLVAKNQRFMEFIKKCSSNRMYRLYDFRTIMTRTISRPAKYGLLIETIMKNECNQFSPQYGASEKAYETARRFAMRIDNNLSIYQMSRRWEDIKKNFDTSSQVTMFIADKTVPDGCVKVPWNLDSICKPMKPAGGGDKERKLMCIGEAQVKANGLAKLTPMHLVAFDDILVFLYKKNGKFVFAPMDQPVLSLHALIVRRLAGHSLNMMLITPVKSALIDLEFQTKVDLNKWTKVLDCAVHEAPSRVRLTKRENDEYVRQTTFEHEKLERKQKEIEETWMKQLVELFERQGTEEVAMFSNYVGKRNDFSTALQNHLEQIPLRGRPDLVERVKDSVRAKFRDLKQMKTVPMRKLIDDMTQAKETILWSYLQELENGTAVRDADSDGGSGSDSSGSGKSKQPRRIKTFSGATVESTSKIKGGIRRHTTVPRMGMKEEDESDDTRRETEQAEEKAHNLPLTQSLTCHRECRRLIKDLEKLKSENLTLKNELALDKLRITSLEKMRSTSSTALSTSVDTLEALRRKEKDVREEEIKTKKKLEGIEKEIRHQKEKLDEERKQFEEKRMLYEMEQKKQQAQLEEKWAALKEVGLNGEICSPTRKVSVPVRMNNDVCPAVKSPQPGPATMPSLIPTNLAVKTEYKKKK